MNKKNSKQILEDAVSWRPAPVIWLTNATSAPRWFHVSVIVLTLQFLGSVSSLTAETAATTKSGDVAAPGARASAASFKRTPLPYRDLAERVVDLERLARVPLLGARASQSVGELRAADLTAKTNADSSSSADTERALARFGGPGFLNRFIFSAARDDINPDARLRFLVDGREQEALSFSMATLLQGKAKPFTAPLSKVRSGKPLMGNYFFPIPFSESLEIRASVGHDAGKNNCFRYAFQANRPPMTKTFEPFSARLLSQYESDFAPVIAKLAKQEPLFDPCQNTVRHMKKRRLSPGDRRDLLVLKGAGLIRQLRIKPSNREGDALRQLAIRIYTDIDYNLFYDSIPMVAAPLGDFFGLPFGRPGKPFKTLMLEWGENGGVIRYVMPYGYGARIEIENGSNRFVEIELEAYVEERKAIGTDYGRFRAIWRRVVRPDNEMRPTGLKSEPEPKPAPEPAPFIALDLRAKGWLLGVTESIVSDTALAPGASISPAIITTNGRGNLAGLWDSALPETRPSPREIGRGGYLTANAIPFTRSIKIVKSLKGYEDYAAVFYWYQHDLSDLKSPLPPPRKRLAFHVTSPRRYSDAIEAESLKATPRVGKSETVSAKGYSGAQWGNNAFLRYFPEHPTGALNIELKPAPSLAGERAAVWARVAKGPRHGKFQLDVADAPVIDGYARCIELSPWIKLGEINVPDDQPLILPLKVVGENPLARNNLLEVDMIRLEPLPNQLKK